MKFLKALFHSFLGTAIIEAIFIVFVTVKGVFQINFSDVYVWCIIVGFAVAAAIVSALICLIQNAIVKDHKKGGAK